jgi:hypothetical protein
MASAIHPWHITAYNSTCDYVHSSWGGRAPATILLDPTGRYRSWPPAQLTDWHYTHGASKIGTRTLFEKGISSVHWCKLPAGQRLLAASER